MLDERGQRVTQRADLTGGESIESIVGELEDDAELTAAAMAAMGWCPSGRLFEAAACGVPIVSELLTITDDPLIPKAFGSRKFDNEGIAAKPRTIIENGVLKSYYIDTYYGRKLKLEPTSGGMTSPVSGSTSTSAMRRP